MKQVITSIKMRDRGLFCPRLRPGLALLVVWIVLSMLVSACGGATPAPTSAPTEPGVTGTVAPEQDRPAPGTGVPEGGAPEEGTPEGEAPQEGAPELEGEIPSAEGVATAVSARTPIPTPTPGPVAREIEAFAAEAGLAGKTFLGLAIEDWINLAVSGLVILIGYFAIRLLVFVLRKIAKGTVPTLDDDVLALIARILNWLLLLWVVHFAALRLDFLSDSLRTNVRDISFVLALGIVTAFAIRAIGLVAQGYRDGLASRGDQRKLTPVILTVQRLAQSMVLIIAVSILLAHLGFDVSIIAAILIVSGLILSFGAQDILTDFLSGFIILIDQPFRVGDSILIKELNTRGTVLEIGPRSTQIRTGDNREVIVPNSSIGQSQVINYTYPDSRYRTQTEIGVAYGTDPEEMRKVIVEAVRGVEGVLADKPVDVFYLKFGDSARLVRVRWWIDTYRDEQPMLDKVNTALELLCTSHNVRHVDVVQMGDICFILRLYVGIEPEQQTTRADKDKYGKLAYVVDTYRKARDSVEVNYRITIDGERIEVPGMVLYVVNAAKNGAGLSAAGDLSKVDDGLMDTFILDMNDLHTIAGAMERMLNLDTTSAQKYMRQGKEMTIETDPDQPVWTDGEYAGRTPISLKVLAGALPVIVP